MLEIYSLGTRSSSWDVLLLCAVILLPLQINIYLPLPLIQSSTYVRHSSIPLSQYISLVFRLFYLSWVVALPTRDKTTAEPSVSLYPIYLLFTSPEWLLCQLGIKPLQDHHYLSIVSVSNLLFTSSEWLLCQLGIKTTVGPLPLYHIFIFDLLFTSAN